MEETDIKEKLIQAAMELIQADDGRLTVRSIAEKAGVTQGLVNYHFQSKDNLVNIAARRVVDETVQKLPAMAGKIDGTPEKKLRFLVKGTLRYMTTHPNVTKLSIMQDLQYGHSADNMQTSIDAFDEVLRPLIPDEKKRFLAGHVFCAAIQVFFMRAEVLEEMRGIDIFDGTAQTEFIDALIDMVLKGTQEGEKDNEAEKKFD